MRARRNVRRREDWLVNVIGGLRDAKHRSWYFLEFRSLCAEGNLQPVPDAVACGEENHGEYGEEKEKRGRGEKNGESDLFFFFQETGKNVKIISGYVIYALFLSSDTLPHCY